MARKQRTHYPGALYHVMVRGNNGERILAEALHKDEYIKILSHYKQQFSFKIYAFCIMDNHAHFLIEVNNTPLSTIMQRVQQVYTQRYNRKYARTGHVFQQRYKALPCKKEEYLLQLIKYIHYNPIRAKIVNSIKDYLWSSHSQYIGKVKNDLADVTTILEMFSGNRKEAVKLYLQFMDQLPEELESGNYVEEYQPYEAGNNDQSINQSIDEVVERVCSIENVSVEEITRKTRIQKISDIRKAIVLLSERYCNVTNTVLSSKMNLPLSMISKIKSGECKGVYVQEIIQRFEKCVSE